MRTRISRREETRALIASCTLAKVEESDCDDQGCALEWALPPAEDAEAELPEGMEYCEDDECEFDWGDEGGDEAETAPPQATAAAK